MITCFNSLHCLFKFVCCSHVKNVFSGQTSNIKVQLKRSECKLCSKEEWKTKGKNHLLQRCLHVILPRIQSPVGFLFEEKTAQPSTQRQLHLSRYDSRGRRGLREFYALKIESPLVFFLCFHVIQVCFWIIQSSNLQSNTILHSCFRDSFRCRGIEV